MGSKLCPFIRFWRNLTKKDSVETLRKLKMIIFFTCTDSFWAFFSWIRIGSGFLADPPDPDSGKKSDPDPDTDKRTRIRITISPSDPAQNGPLKK